MNKFLFFLIVLIVFVSGCATQYQAGETTVTPQYSLESIDYPSSVKADEEFTVSWKVSTNLPTTIKHTAVHYSTDSHPGDYGLDIAPVDSGYGSLTKEYASGNFSIPNTFSVKIKTPDAVKLYFRAHAIIDGKNYWTSEYLINVEGDTAQPGTLQGEVTPPVKEQPAAPTTKEFTIEADDRGFYINNQDISSVSANKGSVVKITFQVRSQGVYYGGLDFRGCGQDTPNTSPGSSASVQFTADNTCTITSYWPSSGVVKDSMQVVVS